MDNTPLRQLRKRLLAWYDRTKRILPFRDIDDPYGIWVSEIMLQQTPVDRVCDFWRRFMARFPTVSALAEAPESDVLKYWEGLGYYSRARNLHAAAKHIVAESGGQLPRTPDELRRLPGLGAYTSASVASIAFGFPAAVVDANVVRVIARLDGLTGDPKSAALRMAIAARAQELLETKRPGDWNQAVMELGAMVCSPTNPGCASCPLQPDCAATASGEPERYPAKTANTRTRTVREVAVALIRGEHILVEQRPAGGLWPNLWVLPFREVPPGESPHDAAQALLAHLGLRVRDLGPERQVQYGVTTKKVTLTCHVIAVTARQAAAVDLTRRAWTTDAATLGMAAPHRRLLAAIRTA